MSISSKALVSGRDFPATWDQFLDWFPDNAACLQYLEKLRWPDGFETVQDVGEWMSRIEPRAGTTYVPGLRLSRYSYRWNGVCKDAHAAAPVVCGSVVCDESKDMVSVPWDCSVS